MINAIFATDKHGGIGHRGSMPWQNIKKDLQYFKDTTNDQIVIMGRHTWESPDMPKPLPNRINAVVTTNYIPNVPNVFRINPNHLSEGLDLLHQEYSDKEIFIIGGKQLIMLALPIIQKLFITQIKGDYESDVKLDIPTVIADFTLTSTLTGDKTCSFEVYTRKE